ncbi:colicin I receptor domain protein [Shigella flexneri K-304]|nr:colicin I receptor domain protein [Shigella flexneri K-304]EJL13968.1 tonB-dependent Receptor Plug domain protein [Shigella flexneri 6603-63]
MVVTASSVEQNLKDAPASISVITQEDLQRKPVQNLKDVLKEVPGVQLTNEGDNRKGVSIRGLDSSYTLILVDGKRVNSRNAVFRHNDFDLNWIPVDSIERIEVVRGPMSSLYGSDALGGVVNIITKKSVRNGRVPLPSIPPFRNIAIAVIPITVSSLPVDH